MGTETQLVLEKYLGIAVIRRIVTGHLKPETAVLRMSVVDHGRHSFRITAIAVKRGRDTQVV